MLSAHLSSPEKAVSDPPAFLAQVMVHSSLADAKAVEQHIPLEEFRRVLESAPASVFAKDQ